MNLCPILMNQKPQQSEPVNRKEANTLAFRTDRRNLKNKDLGGIKYNIQII